MYVAAQFSRRFEFALLLCAGLAQRPESSILVIKTLRSLTELAGNNSRFPHGASQISMNGPLLQDHQFANRAPAWRRDPSYHLRRRLSVEYHRSCAAHHLCSPELYLLERIYVEVGNLACLRVCLKNKGNIPRSIIFCRKSRSITDRLHGRQMKQSLEHHLNILHCL